MESEEEKVHYLHLLPLEIWRQILFEVYPPILRLLCENPGTQFDYRRGIFDIQPQRAKLRLICKRLEPIAVEVLFNEIALDSSTSRMQSFFTAVRCITGFKGTLSMPTTSALVQFDRRDDRPKEGKVDFGSLRKLNQYCPHIKLMVTHMTVGPTFRLEVDWIEGIETLVVQASHIDSRILRRISSRVKPLHTMVLDVLTLIMRKPVVVRHIACLDLRYKGASGLPLLSTPNLRRLSIALDRTSLIDASAFFQANGSHLEHLELRNEKMSIPSDRIDPIVRGMVDILHFCPRLTVLEVDSRFISTEQPQTAPLSIHTLILCFPKPGNVVAALDYWGFRVGGGASASIKTVIFKIYTKVDLKEDLWTSVVLPVIDPNQRNVTFVTKPVRRELSFRSSMEI